MLKFRAVHVDTFLAALFAVAAVVLVILSYQAAREADRLYGHNVDSGALTFAFALVYLAPLSLVFALAAYAGSRNWRHHGVLHWLALLGATVPVAWYALLIFW